MFWEAFRATSQAVLQILVLAGVGYFLRKKAVISDTGCDAISRLVIDVTLPLLIFTQLVRDFNVAVYPDWWIFPILSFTVTVVGLVVGFVFTIFVGPWKKKLQFLNLVTFQNSGYLPLALIVSLLPPHKAGSMLIYLFLFLMGFNLVMWPLAVYIFSLSRETEFKLRNVLNPPVIAAIAGLAAVFLGVAKVLPMAALKPLRLIGDCTLPLAMLVVGADLAQIKIKHLDVKAMSWLLIAKLIIMPALGLAFVYRFKVPELVGLLIVLQMAVPSATSLSVIARHYKKEDILISQGVLLTHLASLITIPVFLSLYFAKFLGQ
jgi:hypothetical protein